MPKTSRSDLAEGDLVEIWLKIAEDNPGAADRFLDRLDEQCRTLAEFPAMGRPRDELAPGLRSFTVGRYIVFYRIAEDGIEVARVLSTYRDVASFFP